MLSIEREAFEAELLVLLTAFNVPLTQARKDAYWRGLERMPLSVFARAVDVLVGDGGDSDLPAPSRIWQVSRELRVKAPAEAKAAPPAYDDFHRFGQRALLTFLLTHGAASDAALAKLVEVKNKIVDGVRLSCHGDAKGCDERGDTADFRDVLLAAFARVFEERTWEETEVDRGKFCAERSMAFTPRQRPVLPTLPRTSPASTTASFEPVGDAVGLPDLGSVLA